MFWPNRCWRFLIVDASNDEGRRSAGRLPQHFRVSPPGESTGPDGAPEIVYHSPVMTVGEAVTSRHAVCIAGRRLPIVLPSRTDPRLHLAMVITTVQILGQVAFEFDLSLAQILVSVGACAFLEVAMTLWQRRALVWPASAMLTGNGVALILRVPGTEHGDWWSTRGWWAFALIAGFSLLSKTVIRWKGRHIFNPSNLGLVVGVIAFRFLPIDRMNLLQVDLQDLWWGPMSIGLIALLAVIGLGFGAITRRLGLLGMALTFWGAFSAGTAVIVAGGHCIQARWHIGPLCDWELWRVLVTSPEVLIFLAFMITDPKTTPSSRVQRIAFGGIVGVLAALLLAPQETELRVKIAILSSLVVGCALRPLIERWIPAEVTNPADLEPWFGITPRRMAWGAEGATALIAVLLLAASFSTIEAPLTPESPELAAGLPAKVSEEDLPVVVVDPTAEGLSPPMDESRGRGLAIDVLNALEIERTALERKDPTLAAQADGGARLQNLQDLISSGAPAELALYRFDQMTIQLSRSSPQSPPVLSVLAEGTLLAGGAEQPIEETFQVEPQAGRFVIVAPNPTITAGSSVQEPSAAPPTSGPESAPVIPDDWLEPDKLRGLAFTDVTKAAGLDAPQGEEAKTPQEDQVFPGGVAVEDYDFDGDQDLYLTRTDLPNRMYRNDGTGAFTDVAETAGLAGTADKSGDGAPVWGDIDGDGDLDLLVTSATGPRVVLFVNGGDGTFTEEASGRGIDVSTERSSGLTSHGAAFGDVDRDGDLDLFIARWIGEPDLGPGPDSKRSEGCPADLPSRGQPGLFLNDGSGHFHNGTEAWGLDLGDVYAFQPTFADYDADGWPDLLLTGDFCTSRVFRNLEGSGFADVTDQLGVGTDENGMGSTVADFNGDGLLDWFVTAISYPTGDSTCPFEYGCSGNRLYLNQGEGSQFEDATDHYGLRNGYWGWGSTVVDLNHDGNLDVVQTNGNVGDSYFAHDPTTVWVSPGEPPLARSTQRVGLDDSGLGKSAVAFDAEGDGDLDILIVNTGTAPSLWRNDLPVDQNWIQVRLVDEAGRDPRAIGARVTVDLPTDKRARITAVSASGSFQGQDPTTLHFGLGDEITGDNVTVRVMWPGSTTPQVRQVRRGSFTTIKRS